MPRKANSSPQTVKLLEALLSQPGDWRYGYDLSKQTGLKSGTLYPQLMRMEAAGWLIAEWEATPTPGKPSRHMYRLTALGESSAKGIVAAQWLPRARLQQAVPLTISVNTEAQ